MGFAFPKEERAALVASEPETFHLPRESDMRFNWVQAWLSKLDEDRMTELVLDAWRMVVPKKVWSAHLASAHSPPAHGASAGNPTVRRDQPR
jgi:hypothetical protein